VHLGIGYAVDDAQHLARGQVQVAVHLGGVVLERIFERFPIDRHITRRPCAANDGGGFLVLHDTRSFVKETSCAPYKPRRKTWFVRPWAEGLRTAGKKSELTFKFRTPKGIAKGWEANAIR
jgi:hypothetical protein